MSMVTINLRSAIKVTIPDASGAPHEYDLVAGANEVPAEVAEHWYVKKFIVPAAGRAPRTVMPSAQLSAAMIAKAKAATEEIKAKENAKAPAPPAQTADVPVAPAKAPEAAEKAKS